MLEWIAYKHKEEDQLVEKIKAYFMDETYCKKVFSFYEQYEEKVLFREINRNGIEVGSEQFKKIYKIVLEQAIRLKMKSPSVYIYQDPAYRIKVQGMNEPWVEISSGLVEAYTDKELKFMITRKLCHIKEEHHLTEILCEQYIKGIVMRKSYEDEQLEVDDEVFLNLAAKWRRVSAYTEDKYAYLLTADIQAGVKAIQKETIQSKTLAEEMNLSLFLSKGKNFYEVLGADKPYSVFRIKELIYFASSDEAKNYLGKEKS